MHAAALFVATAVLGVNFGWQPTRTGELEYIIQIEPELIDSLLAGEAVASEIPPELGGVRKFRIQLGRDPLPRRGAPAAPKAAAGPANTPAPTTDTGGLPPLVPPAIAGRFDNAAWNGPAAGGDDPLAKLTELRAEDWFVGLGDLYRGREMSPAARQSLSKPIWPGWNFDTPTVQPPPLPARDPIVREAPQRESFPRDFSREPTYRESPPREAPYRDEFPRVEPPANASRTNSSSIRPNTSDPVDERTASLPRATSLPNPPAGSPANTIGGPTESAEMNYTPTTNPNAKPWGWLTAVIIALFASMGVNLYQGWTLVGVRRRYFDLVSQLHPRTPATPATIHGSPLG